MRPSRQRYTIRISLLLSIYLVLFFSDQAAAYQCTRTELQASLYWSNTNIPYFVNAQSSSQFNNSLSTIASAIQASFNTWSSATMRTGIPLSSCQINQLPSGSNITSLVFTYGTTNQSYAGYNYLDPENNQNIIVFRDNGWPHENDNQSGVDTIALTTTTFNRYTGEIYDADIEFNSTDNQFGIVDPQNNSGLLQDLQNTLTHEIGHLLGFAHTSDAQACMFGMASTGETTKQTLDCDDAGLLLFRYPYDNLTQFCNSQQDPNTCGFCLPSQGLTYKTQIFVYNQDNGYSNFSCQQNSLSAFWGVFLAHGLRRCLLWFKNR